MVKHSPTLIVEDNPNDPERYARFVSSFGAYIPFAYHLGFELESFEPGHATLVYVPQDEHLNSLSMTHGGALMTLMDVTMASAARSVEPTQRVVTIEMKTTFFNPAQGALKARGELIHKTRQMAFVQANVYDSEGTLCAQSTGTFRYVTPKI
jgi:uncharacterized protein (TIGR00369 family)